MNAADTRNFRTGRALPKEGYCDQPYVVTTDRGDWLCVMTTGKGLEGQSGQHVIASISCDRGRTWTEPVDIEPAGGPEASWAMPLKVPSGRIYVFYTYNESNMRTVVSDSGEIERVDSLGAFAFRYSDDHGRSWSETRYTVEVRPFEIDRENPYQGHVRFWWGVSKPIIHRGAAYVGFSKIGRFGHGFMARTEGAFLRSDNILTEHDPNRIQWQTLPDGEVGLRSPDGPVADEHNLVGLDDGSLYCAYRTIDGALCHAYSRDGGHSWTAPAHAVYAPGGSVIKHPRAAGFVRRLSGGRFILWYHNNGTRWYNSGSNTGSRNIAWLAGGVEREGRLYWGQPEIVLYNDDFRRGSSYPDFIEEGGRLYIVSTQKTDARVVDVEARLLEGLWSEESAVTRKGLLLDLGPEQLDAAGVFSHGELPDFYGPWEKPAPELPLAGRGGLTLELWVRFERLVPGQVLAENRGDGGEGLALLVGAAGNVRLELNDGWVAGYWESDAGLLHPGRDHHIVAIVDGGPKVISFVVDGRLCDGGAERPFGWGRFSPFMRDVTGSGHLRLSPADARMLRLRLYGRYLRTAEALANYRSGP